MQVQNVNNPLLVSIVIPMLNEIESIENCLNSIFAQDYPDDHIEILVVDGCSSDGSREKVLELAKIHLNIRLFDNLLRRTPISLNIGIKNSSGDVIIILGAHTRIRNDFVKQNIRLMQEQGVKCTGGTQLNTGKSFMQRAIGLAMGSRFGIPSAPYRFHRKPCFVDTVVYAAYARELFDEVGYFNEELHISEDAEFNWRIRKAGYRIYFSPEIVSYYYPRKNLLKLIKQFFNYGILRVNVVKKHPDAIRLIHLMPPVFVVILISLGVMSMLTAEVAVPLFVLLGTYFSYIVAGSFITCQERNSWNYLFILPAVFIAMQISWGAGFLVGVFKTST
jgi:glycosyltransferase involved in cell wall biosynthesis